MQPRVRLCCEHKSKQQTPSPSSTSIPPLAVASSTPIDAVLETEFRREKQRRANHLARRELRDAPPTSMGFSIAILASPKGDFTTDTDSEPANTRLNFDSQW